VARPWSRPSFRFSHSLQRTRRLVRALDPPKRRASRGEIQPSTTRSRKIFAWAARHAAQYMHWHSPPARLSEIPPHTDRKTRPSPRGTIHPCESCGNEASFLSHSHLNTIILPRQARDKHRDDSKEDMFSALLMCVQSLSWQMIALWKQIELEKVFSAPREAVHRGERRCRNDTAHIGASALDFGRFAEADRSLDRRYRREKQRFVRPGLGEPCRNVFVFKLSVRLSRACLGNIRFSVQNGAKVAFLYRGGQTSAACHSFVRANSKTISVRLSPTMETRTLNE
jgi:hypothetical protein